VLENDRVRMWDYTWKPGAATGLHTHDTDTIEVFITGGTIRTTTADGETETHEVAFKTARLVPRGRVDREEAVAGEPRAIVIEVT
jgi:dihydroxyacid dehydratase/phosphogluconate dehydratase